MNAAPRTGAALAASCPWHAVIKFERFVREIPMLTMAEAEAFIANALKGPQRSRIVATAVVPTPVHWSVQRSA